MDAMVETELKAMRHSCREAGRELGGKKEEKRQEQANIAPAMPRWSTPCRACSGNLLGRIKQQSSVAFKSPGLFYV